MKEFSKLLEVSARIAGAITVASAIILFFPSSWLPFDISEVRYEYGIIIFIIFVLAFAIWISYFVKWVTKIIIKQHEKKQNLKLREKILENLSNREKEFLKEYYDLRDTAIQIDIGDTMHKRLQTFNVISLSPGNFFVDPYDFSMPGFIQPWVFDLIDNNPNLLKTKNTQQEKKS